MSKKRHVWLVLMVLVLIGAALFSLLSRRAAAVLHLPNSTAGIQDITLAKTTPGGETGEVFVQDYTLTPNREAELVQEVCDWLKTARFRDPRFSTTEFGSGLLGGGTVYLIGVQPSDGDALSAVQILDDGRVAISGVFLYWLDEKDMDGLRAIFDHLNTITIKRTHCIHFVSAKDCLPVKPTGTFSFAATYNVSVRLICGGGFFVNEQDMVKKLKMTPPRCVL